MPQIERIVQDETIVVMLIITSAHSLYSKVILENLNVAETDMG